MPDRDVPRVLVVDDDARVRHFLTTALGAAGFAVTATGTGEEGLRLAAARPELVVLDVDLPDLSGREVCRRLKVAEETAIIPVLMLSGVFTDVADRSQALEDGSDAYLIKPVTSRELVAMARALLRTARAERRSHEHQRAAEELRRRVAQSKAMVDVARSITASLDLQGVLDRIVDEACLLLGARRVAIAVLEASEPMPIIRFRAVRGLSPAFAQRLRPLSWRDGTTPMAIHERRPVWTADVLRDPALELTLPTRAIIEAEGYRAVLSVPLLAARASQVWVDDPANAMLRIEGTVSVDPALAEQLGKFKIMPHGDGLTGSVFATRTPMFVRDLRSEPRFRAQAIVDEGAVRAYAGIPPVAAEGVVVGVLSLLFGERGDFTDEEQERVR